MPWQIQVRRKIDGREWEPVSVERCRVISGAYERQYHYETLDEVKLAFAEYVDVEGGLPNLLIRLATGQPKFTDKYDVRFVWTSQPGIVWCPETIPEPKPASPGAEQDPGEAQMNTEAELLAHQLIQNAVVYYSLTPDIPIGAAIHNRALIGHETRLWGLTTIVKVDGRSPDTGAQYLYILALAGPHSTFRLVYKLNLWRPTIGAEQEPPTFVGGTPSIRRHYAAGEPVPPLSSPAATDSPTGAEQEPPNARRQTFEEIVAEDARRAAEFQAGTEQEPPKPFRKAEPGEPTPLYPDAATAERIACIADIEAAFYGDGRITDRYDIMNFILDRINARAAR